MLTEVKTILIGFSPAGVEWNCHRRNQEAEVDFRKRAQKMAERLWVLRERANLK